MLKERTESRNVENSKCRIFLIILYNFKFSSYYGKYHYKWRNSKNIFEKCTQKETVAKVNF